MNGEVELQPSTEDFAKDHGAVNAHCMIFVKTNAPASQE